MRAVRATVVMAGLFAIADRLLGNIQVATFAAFGSFATLVLSSFAGSRRDKLMAHTLLALAGSALLMIGTAVSSSTLLAALVSVPVTFLVFYAGVAGPNAASGSIGALLAYVLPAASPGTVAMIPDRLAGWWMASVAGTAAVLVFSPAPNDGGLRAAAAKLARTLAEELERARAGSGEAGLATCVAAKDELLGRFNAAPYRPLGLAAPDQALANVVELLDWCTLLVIDAVREHPRLGGAPKADRELLAATAGTLEQTSLLLSGEPTRPDLEGLAAHRDASLAAVRSLVPHHDNFRRDAQIAFHARAVAVTALAIGGEAMVAQRVAEPAWLTARRRATPTRARTRTSDRLASTSDRLAGYATAAARNASVRSVWFVNSVRVALALGAAVAIAGVSSVQHGFWVVLGTLSVLRTNAASTRASALQALTGTVVGFVVGAALLLAIGTSATVLWAVLPVAVFVAAYAPGTVPFAVGQAAFTVTLAVLFNLLAPVGWKVGLVRVEDVAIGCAVSVAVGAMFWPRGIAALVGDDLADAFRYGGRFLAQSVRWTAGLHGEEPDGEAAALAAGVRLEDALRGFLTERGSKRVDKRELWRLVGGTLRLRLTAHSVASMPREPIAVAAAREALEHRAGKLAAWYERLAQLLDRPSGATVAPLEPPRFGPEDVVLDSWGSQYAVWLCEHLDHLAEHLHELTGPAVKLAELRRTPWWR